MGLFVILRGHGHPELARIFEGIEKGGEWPDPLCYAPTALLPKAGGSDEDGATKKRPITVASIWYRLYASIRYQELMSRWAVNWLPAELRGGVPKGECADVTLELGLEIEYSLLGDEDLFGAQLDESKAYDSAPREIPSRPVCGGAWRRTSRTASGASTRPCCGTSASGTPRAPCSARG